MARRKTDSRKQATREVALPSASCSRRFFIAQPGDLIPPNTNLQRWHEWEVGDSRGQDRICLTSCKRKAELIRDALEAFHENR